MQVRHFLRSPLFTAIAVLSAVVYFAAGASAYETFESTGGGGDCLACHSSFKGFGALHGQHTDMISSCTVCHVNVGDNPKITLDPDVDRGCVGCHGRIEDGGNDWGSDGFGAGLRQRHENTGNANCGGCHSDEDSSSYTPVGEDVVPLFYGTVAQLDPCTDTLDNDGDLLVDANDPDCTPDNLPPVADAGGNYTGSVGVAVEFDGSGSSDPDGTIVSYAWDFGDGSTSTDESPTHTYTSAGTFDVTLTVTDDGGATDTDQVTATISASGNLPPVVDPGGPYTGGVGQPISFDASNTFDPDGDPLIFMWVFARGTPPVFGETATHTWDAAGDYTVILTVTDGIIDNDPVVVVVPVEVVEMNAPPVVDPGGPYSGVVGEAVQFDGSNTTDPDGDPLTYEWDFGDGNTSTEVSPTHTYDTAGTYTATLTVSDGINDPVAANVSVEITEEVTPPVGDTWLIKAPFGYLQDGFTVTFEQFAGIIITHVVYADGQTSIGVGMDWGDVIYWMDMTGGIYFGNINRDAGTMSGIAFFVGGVSIWFGEQQ